MMKSKLTTSLALAALFVSTLSACSSGPSLGGSSNELSMTPEQLAQTPQRDLMLLAVPTFDADGRTVPPPPLTRIQANMLGNIEQFCATQAKERLLDGALLGLAAYKDRSNFIGLCQLRVIERVTTAGDKRLANIVGVEVPGLSSRRLSVDWNAVSETSLDRCLKQAGSDQDLADKCMIVTNLPPDDAPAGSMR